MGAIQKRPRGSGPKEASATRGLLRARPQRGRRENRHARLRALRRPPRTPRRPGGGRCPPPKGTKEGHRFGAGPPLPQTEREPLRTAARPPPPGAPAPRPHLALLWIPATARYSRKPVSRAQAVSSCAGHAARSDPVGSDARASPVRLFAPEIGPAILRAVRVAHESPSVGGNLPCPLGAGPSLVVAEEFEAPGRTKSLPVGRRRPP
jgi:hypothetical protein